MSTTTTTTRWRTSPGRALPEFGAKSARLERPTSATKFVDVCDAAANQNVKIWSARFSAGFGAFVSGCFGLMIGGGGSTA